MALNQLNNSLQRDSRQENRVDDQEYSDDNDENNNDDEEDANSDDAEEDTAPVRQRRIMRRKDDFKLPLLTFKDVEESMEKFSGDDNFNVKRWLDDFK